MTTKLIAVPTFTTTHCDVELCIHGDYSAPDLSCNWQGDFTINKVWVTTDIQQQDISDILAKAIFTELEHEGFMKSAQADREMREEKLCRDEDAFLERVRNAARGIA